MRHDEAFKNLLLAHPGDIIAAFAPELGVAYGDTSTVQIESVELLPRVKGMRRSRYVDFAVTVRWPAVAGSTEPTGQAVLVLTEHFSAPSKVDLSRVALYTSAMMHRHPGIPVLPIVVVGHSKGRQIRSHLLNQVLDFTVLDFRCRLFHVDTECLPAWDRTRSPLLAVLSALMRDQPKVQVAFRAVQRLRASRDGDTLLAQRLPLIEDFASLDTAALEQFRLILAGEPDMISVVDMFRAEGEAVGEARGEAKRQHQLIANTCDLVTSGDITRERAIARLQHMVEQQQITAEQAAQAIRTLG